MSTESLAVSDSVTMADKCDVSRIVTAFLFNTCRLPPWPSICDIQAAGCCGEVTANHPDEDEEVELIPLITGSAAEFYVKPMLPHCGDVDIMIYDNTVLAIPRGHPPPTQLPAEFKNYVRVFEIIDSDLPGYVYLEARCLLTQRIDDNKYEYFEYDGRQWLYFEDKTGTSTQIHGPALLKHYDVKLLLPLDLVHCIRCLSWPPQAADWPTRHRNYGWPDSATFDRVVTNGCDVVRVAHRQCRQDEWMSKHQCRLSFSRAEIVLMNSWMPVQQIAYHLLRVYVKTERFRFQIASDETAFCSFILDVTSSNNREMIGGQSLSCKHARM